MKNHAIGFKYTWFYGKRSYLAHWFWIAGCFGMCFWSLYRMINSSSESPPALSLLIEKPHFYSISSDNNPYHIYAKSIEYSDSKKVSFSYPWAEYTMRSQKLTAHSEKGIWDGRCAITLEQNVHIQDSHGRSLKTNQANFLYNSKEIHGHAPIHGKSPQGTFSAQGFAWTGGHIYAKSKRPPYGNGTQLTDPRPPPYTSRTCCG